MGEMERRGLIEGGGEERGEVGEVERRGLSEGGGEERGGDEEGGGERSKEVYVFREW